MNKHLPRVFETGITIPDAALKISSVSSYADDADGENVRTGLAAFFAYPLPSLESLIVFWNLLSVLFIAATPDTVSYGRLATATTSNDNKEKLIEI